MAKSFMNFSKILVLPVGLFLVFTVVAKGFGTHSIPIVISQSMIPIVEAMALALFLDAGLMDFSIGARVIFAATMGGMLAQRLGVLGLIIGCFVVSIIEAICMGVLYRLLRIPSMVVSIGVLLIFEVLAAKIAGTNGYVTITSDIYTVGSYPYNIIWIAVSLFLFYILYYRTSIGAHITAIGNDERMCKNVGIQVDKIKFLTIALSGVFGGFAALLTISYAGSVTTITDMRTMSMIFRPIMCVVLARSMKRYFDNLPVLILVAGICISIIFNGFIAMGISDAWQNILLGVFLLVVLGWNVIYSNVKKGLKLA